MKLNLLWHLPLLLSLILITSAVKRPQCTYLEYPEKPFCTKYPLHWAATADNVTDVENLLKEGIRIDQKTGRGYSGNTALHTASRYGRADVVWVLIRNGADDTIRNNKGEFAMDRAHVKFCNWNRNNKECTLADSDYAATMALLQYGCKSTGCIDELDCDAHRCFKQKHTHGISQNTQSSSRHNTQRNTRIIRDACGPHTWFWWSNQRCINYQFHWSSVAGDEAKVASYLQDGTDVDLRDGERYTPLMLAGWAGRAGIVSLLLKNGADSSLTNVRGRTALLLASKTYCRDPNSKGCRLGNVDYDETVKLIQQGCSVTGCNKGLLCVGTHCKKHTPEWSIRTTNIHKNCGPHIWADWSDQRCEDYPFHWAALIGDNAQVTRFLDKRTDVNLRDGYEYRYTPLMQAAWAGHSSTVSLLLDHGADASLINVRGQSAYDLASKQFCRESWRGCRLGETDYDETLQILRGGSSSVFDPAAVVTQTGTPCVRFQYHGTWYEATKCKCCWNSKPWCATSTSAQGYIGNWDYCNTT